MSTLEIYEIPAAEQWDDLGAVVGADGRVIKMGDGVEFLREAAVENDPATAYPVKPGETGWVVALAPDQAGLAQIELDGRRPSSVLAYERPAFLRLKASDPGEPT